MQTVAIIGTGISGMSAGYFLRDKYDVTFYEKEDYAGGHTNTLTVEDFLQKFLVPMSSAVWSTPAETMLEFPVQSLVRFFKNHCFLSLDGQLAWRTCVGGSRQYRDKIMAAFGNRLWTKRAAVKIKREAGKVCVTDSTNKILIYDKIILACHADEALGLLDDPTGLESSLLSKFLYLANKTTLHTDERVMPKHRSVWSSWNNRIDDDLSGKPVTTTIYWMNSLQGVSKKKNYFISINDPGLIDPAKILWEKEYTHPLYTVEGQTAQLHLQELNKNGVTFFCGAYFRYGFHEDGLMSGLDAARAAYGEQVWP